MKCVICKEGETRPGMTSVTLERDDATLVMRHVPAEICQNCGEAYLSEEVSQALWLQGERAMQNGVVVEICEFQPTAAV